MIDNRLRKFVSIHRFGYHSFIEFSTLREKKLLNFNKYSNTNEIFTYNT
jgi:hypothetical protein